MSFATIDDLRSQLGGTSPLDDPIYAAKMLHKLPDFRAVKREKFFLDACRGKRVLEFGASGVLHEAIKAVASEYLGIDRESGDRVLAYDLDNELYGADVPFVDPEFYYCDPEVIVCGEVVEHLGNPLHFLSRLTQEYAGVPVMISVPNAFSATQRTWIKRGYENVNVDHVAWYSPKTLSVLLQRAGFESADLYWYGGDDYTAEGMVVVAK